MEFVVKSRLLVVVRDVSVPKVFRREVVVELPDGLALKDFIHFPFILVFE